MSEPHLVVEQDLEEEIKKWKELRALYFSDRSFGGTDARILRLPADEYTAQEWRLIHGALKYVEATQWSARMTKEHWRGLLSERWNDTNPIVAARAVSRARYERNQARRNVRLAEIFYRMAWEVPFLTKRVVRGGTKAAFDIETVRFDWERRNR